MTSTSKPASSIESTPAKVVAEQTTDTELGNAPASDESSKSPRTELEPSTEPALVRWLRVNPAYRRIALPVVAAAILLASAVIAYFCWFVLLLPVWRWGFEPPTWRAVLSLFAAFYLVLGPIAPFILGTNLLGRMLNLYTEEREQQLKASLTQLEASKALTEESLAANDQTGLIPLVRYSRLQLESYYTIGLGQSQRSFRYSILAMWIGFLVITGGIILSVMPSRTGTAPPPDIHLLTIASGMVIELISALFLWIYRSSIGQLTYFYNRQMYLHGVLVAMRIADTMKDSDGTKRLIVERILDPRSQDQPRLPALYKFRGGSLSDSPTPPSPTS